jgi:hypothetical protein
MRRHNRYRSAEPLTARGQRGMPINVRARDHPLHVRQRAGIIVGL